MAKVAKFIVQHGERNGHCAKVVGYVCDHVYPYANDTHIDAALRAIVKEMEVKS